MVSSFAKISKVGVNYFGGLFSTPYGCPIKEILEVIDLFPRSIIEDVNESLQEEIMEGKVLATLEEFQKRKSPGLDAIQLSFFLDSMIL
jgi:hypothetical protein